jgi:hypothetical protein
VTHKLPKTVISSSSCVRYSLVLLRMVSLLPVVEVEFGMLATLSEGSYKFLMRSRDTLMHIGLQLEGLKMQC